MKKFLIGLVSILVILMAIVYGLLFTSFGNSMLKPIIEAKINEKLPQKISLQTFKLTPSTLNLLIKVDQNSKIEAKGGYSLFKQSFDIKYLVDIDDLSKIAPLIGTKLQGPFETDGSVKGGKEKLNIVGKSSVVGSRTTYYVVLEDFKPKNVKAEIKDAKLAKILYMLSQPVYADADININADMDSLDVDNLEGKIKATMENGHTFPKVLHKEFNLTGANVSFKLNADSNIKSSIAKSNLIVDSNIAHAKIENAVVDIKKQSFDINYLVDVKKLSNLAPLIGIKLNGPFETDGSVKGDKKRLKVVGKAKVVGSNTNYDLTLKNFKPKNAKIDIKDAKLAKILYMLSQPIYADASIDVHADMSSLDMNDLEGIVKTRVKNGYTFPKVLHKEFNLTDAKIGFSANADTNIKKSIAKTKLNVDSTVAKVNVQNAIFNIKKNSLTSDYTVYVPNLDKLYFATKKHLKGDIKVTGDVKKDRDLVLTAHSDTLGGKVDAKLINNDFTGKIKGIEIVELTDMLIYPRIFDSSANADIDYNLLSKKGNIHANLLNGRILPNKVSFLLNQMARFDITKEIYKETKIDSKIDNRTIVSNLDMNSRLTHISSQNALLDLDKNYVDAKLQIDIKKTPVFVKIKGNINKPKIGIDAKSLIKTKAKEKIKKEIEKKIPSKLKDKVNNILKMF